ncbi:DUF6924 domain-containing protein [Amycolatopsis jejuensis]|uniref:DUF6924 domain-containing protein n=1 Tax=Amycolatopsis jejuensis TaxID=330084 RepID=UPI0005276136|nr:hypothetical protein [Amycolatopsis jejuensis]
MRPVSEEASGFTFRMWRRNAEQWVPEPELRVRLDDGVSRVPAQLSWVTEDGTQSALAFSPDMTGCYGHRRTTGGDLLELRGELAGRPDGESRYEFVTTEERLRLLIDDGSSAAIRWVTWHDHSGNAGSVAFRAAVTSGNPDVTGLVTAVQASAEHRDAGEVAANLVDPSGSKWLAFHDWAWLNFHLSEPVPADRYVLTSANDAPDRDPAAWVLRGSADGAQWRVLDVRTGQSFPGRHQSRTYRIAEPAPCAHYRLEITATNGSPDVQLEAVRFLTGIGGFSGYRQQAGQAPVAYQGVVVEQTGQHSGSWLPLGGKLSMESLTSPSGRFTFLAGVYSPQLSIRDNLTREYVWVWDAQRASVLSLGPDGDLVAWDHNGQRVWSTGTAWQGVQRLDLHDTGELALTDADGRVRWSSGIPEVPAAPGEVRTVARGSTMRPGESLSGQSLTSDDGSTVLFHDGRVLFCIVKGRTSHLDRFYDRDNVLELGTDGYLRTLALDGSEMERIAGPGSELVVARGAAELRDEAGAVVWASVNRSTRIASRAVREPAMPLNETLAAWFAALSGQGQGFCVAVVKDSTPAEVLEGVGVAPGSAVHGTWRELRQQPGGSVAAAIAVGPDVILLSEDAELPPAPWPWCAALQAPSGGAGYGTRFTLHHHGKLVSEFADQPRRAKGAKVPEVAAALAESVHPSHRFELLFRVAGVVPSAAQLGGVLLGGVTRPAPVAPPDPGSDLPHLVIGDRDELSPLVIRTDFTDDYTWNRVLAELREPWGDSEPEPYLISVPAYDGVPPERILKAVRAAMPELPGAIFIADTTTMRAEKYPLLAVSTQWDGEPFGPDEDAFATQFRVRPNAAIEISCNLGIANMDFEDFASDEVGERMDG